MSKRRTSDEKYKGVLAKPPNVKQLPKFEFSGPVTPENAEEIAKASQRHQQERDRILRLELDTRIAALFDHFGVQGGDWRSLSLRLAGAHIPGFQIPRTLELNYLARHVRARDFFGFRIVGKIRGASKKWDAGQLALLYRDYLMLKKSEESDREIVVRLLDQSPWKDYYPRPKSARRRGPKDPAVESLESRLQDAKKMQKEIASACLEFARSPRAKGPPFTP